jgi:hypothetical protein
MIVARDPRAAEASGRAHSLFGGLSVNEKNPGKSEDEIIALIRRHSSSSTHARGS